MKKTIKFQTRIKVWQECTALFECPDGETDVQTYARLRQEGADSALEYDDVDTLDDTEEPIPDEVTGTPYTFDFGDESRDNSELGVLHAGGNDPYTEDKEHEEFTFDRYQADDDAEDDSYNDWVLRKVEAGG